MEPKETAEEGRLPVAREKDDGADDTDDGGPRAGKTKLGKGRGREEEDGWGSIAEGTLDWKGPSGRSSSFEVNVMLPGTPRNVSTAVILPAMIQLNHKDST